MESSIQRTLAENDTAIVGVRGEIDFANCDDVAGYVRAALTEWSPAEVRVDLREATFIDSTGLGALIEGYKACIETGAHFVVVNPTRAFRRVLDVTGLAAFFGLTESSLSVAETSAETTVAGAGQATGA